MSTCQPPPSSARASTRAEAILTKLGVTPTQAINMLYAQIELRKAVPGANSHD
ncbi:MAG: hypothetical protein WC205_02860 [Opitutaceae bacterium]